MRKRESKYLAKGLVLGMLLSGGAGVYLAPRAEAADNTIKAAATTNSITVNQDNDVRYGAKSSGTSLYIVGITGEENGPFTVTMTGDKTITVTDDQSKAAGGNNAFAMGVYSDSDTHEVTVLGGTIDVPIKLEVTAIGGGTSTSPSSYAVSTAYGLYGTNLINGNAMINVESTGGTTNGDASSTADGLFGTNTINGNAMINVESTGGTANSAAYSTADGLYGTNLINGNAMINVESTGGTSANGNAHSYAYGLSGTNTISGDATIKIAATGGTSDNNSANSAAYGLSGTNTISGNATISVESTSGTANSAAYSDAYGLRGTNTISGNATIKIAATGGTGSTVYAHAFGLYTNRGKNTVSGNVDIATSASSGTAGAYFKAYSLFAFDESSSSSGTNDLSSTGKLKTIKGDVYARSYGVNSLVLDTDGSYLQGNVISENKGLSEPYDGVNNITISNGAVWRPVYDNRYGTDCSALDAGIDTTNNVASNKVSSRATTYDTTNSLGTTITLNENGIIDLTWDGWDTDHKIYDVTRAYRTNGEQQTSTFRNLTIANLKGADGILRVDADLAKNKADTLTVGSSSTATTLKVQVNYDNFYAASALGDTVTGVATVVTDNSGNLTVSGMNSEYNAKTFAVTVERASDYETSKNWNITKLEDTTPTPAPTPTPVYSENTKQAANSRDNVNNIWQIETNSLVKRLGDLRSMAKNATKHDSLWVKYGHGTQKVSSEGRTTELKYNQFQGGYDKLFERQDGTMYRGMMVSRINGDASYERGTGTTNETTLGLYQTWFGKKGHFYDVIVRQGKINTDYNVTDLSNNYSTADYSMWATTLSGEYGYRKELGKGAYLEPSAEVILGRVGSASYATSLGMNTYLEATKHAVTRLGFVVGKDFGQGNAYFKTNYYHDFAGGGNTVTDSVTYENTKIKNWWEMGIGGNVQLAKNASAYAEVRKLFGNLKSNVNFSVGARWSF